MAKLLNFEQDPDARDGAGMFHFDSGVSRYGYDPELASQAAQLKERLDAAPDERLASNAPRPGGANWKDLSKPTESRMDYGDGRGAITLGEAFSPPPTPVASPAGPPANTPPQGPPPGVADVADAARESVAASAAARLMQGGRMVPGSPGFDPQKARETGSYVPDKQSIKTEFGAPYDLEQAQARIGADQNVANARMRQVELQAQQEENALNQARAAAPVLAREAATQQDAMARMQAGYRAQRAALQRELDDYDKNAKVDPGRYMRDPTGLGTIGMAIAQAMGAWASVQSGAPNFAMEIVQRNIDRDIAAQRDEIQNGRISRNNKLGRFMEDFGYDVSQAEAALRIAQNKAVQNQVQLYQLETKTPQTKAAGDVMLAELQRDTLKREQELYNASIGKREVTGSEQFMQPQAATGPRYVEDTPQQQAGLLGLLPKGAGSDVADLEPKERLKLVQSYGEKKADFASLRASYDDLANAYGLKVDWAKGEVTDKNGNPVDASESAFLGKNENIPGVGWGPNVQFQAAERAKEARAKASAITGKALSGASVSPQQAEFIQSYLLGDSDAGAIRGLQRAVIDMNTVERDTEAAFDPATRAEYDKRARGTLTERKRAAAPVKVGDY